MNQLIETTRTDIGDYIDAYGNVVDTARLSFVGTRTDRDSRGYQETIYIWRQE